jgi:hypothetical protein
MEFPGILVPKNQEEGGGGGVKDFGSFEPYFFSSRTLR